MSNTLLTTETLPPTPTARALGLLAAGVPLSLLLDLAAAVPSQDLLDAEDSDTTWVPSRVA